MISQFLVPCPCCTPVREKVEELERFIQDRDECKIKTPAISDVKVFCVQCQERRVVLTEEGKQLAKEILHLLEPRVNFLENFANMANKDAANRAGVVPIMDF